MDLLEMLDYPGPQLLGRHNIDQRAWRAFVLRLVYEGLVQDMPEVTSASRLVEAAKQFYFHNDGLGVKHFGCTADQMAMMPPYLRIQSTRAALAFVNMIPSLQSLDQLLNLAPGPALDDFADCGHNHVGMAMINKILWGLLFSVFEVSANLNRFDLILTSLRPTTTVHPPSRSPIFAGLSTIWASR
ncbi:hypothetical protein GGTG_08860 [Gaeumannomyces tritici R3-111a-1]|uniref:Uncharacterized protein n=1 Tax=Gaeumannomyces tritici (strain R3-111a-1) TaxID=644352 RepID=J3P5S0_GAET3|nr:hypothetical protein GGTG_08860 [Gaeumannomyces tritici R3-111a-1]EJT75022.1 hypothetical protein GGTG_08860 [Gaeumannomyces tritici R3-111a-1]